jgi:hypothetical protein
VEWGKRPPKSPKGGVEGKDLIRQKVFKTLECLHSQLFEITSLLLCLLASFRENLTVIMPLNKDTKVQECDANEAAMKYKSWSHKKN